MCVVCVLFGLELGKYFKFIFMGPRATCFAATFRRPTMCVCGSSVCEHFATKLGGDENVQKVVIMKAITLKT